MGRLSRAAATGQRQRCAASGEREFQRPLHDRRLRARRQQRRQRLVLLRDSPLSVFARHDQESADVQARAERRCTAVEPRRAIRRHRRVECRGTQHRRSVGDDAVGVLQQPAQRHSTAYLRPGTGPDEALSRRRLQDDARVADVPRGPRCAPLGDGGTGQQGLRGLPRRLCQARRRRRCRFARSLQHDQYRGRREHDRQRRTGHRQCDDDRQPDVMRRRWLCRQW